MMHKCLIAAVLVATATAAAVENAHVSPRAVDFINSLDLSWTASLDQGNLISGAETADIKKLCGAQPTAPEAMPARRVFDDAERAAVIPTAFDSKDKWPQCKTITHIRDQSACGSCWAFAATESMSDRYCTYGGPTDLEISAATLMECCSFCGQGCGGGQPALAWNFWVDYGLYNNECQPYPFPKCSHHVKSKEYPPCPKTEYPTPTCKPKTCTATGPNAKTTVYKGNHSFSLAGVEEYQREIMTHGPIEVAFTVYSDFPLYKGGVYTRTAGTTVLGGHAVRAVGWGVLNGVPYWKIANSWNPSWGLNGYFLIKRGVNECGIEMSGVAGSPKL